MNSREPEFRLLERERSFDLADELLIDAEADEVPPPPPTPLSQPGGRIFLAFGIVLVALNLRPALSSLAPVLIDVMRDTGLTASGASLLIMAPILCLGLFGALAPALARQLGTERTILVLLLVLAVGTALRGLPTIPALLAGSILAGAGIGVVNVLLPGLVKRDFPDKAAAMTGLYTMALCAGAAAGAGATVPLADAMAGSWAGALGMWVVPVLVAAVVWLPQLPPRRATPGHAVHHTASLLRDPLAWQVTSFMGLQSSLAYSTFGWMAPILRDRGESALEAGLIVSVSTMVQMVAALVAPVLAARGRDQRFATTIAVGLSLTGLLGCLFAPLSSVWVWAVVLGLGLGSSFAMALMLIVMRSRDSHVAARLSGMAQSIGYTIAAGGPLLVGFLHDWTGGWSAVGVLFTVICLGSVVAGLGAGRASYVADGNIDREPVTVSP